MAEAPHDRQDAVGPTTGRATGSRALLGAYELLLGAVCEGGTDEQLLRRALSVIATVPWPTAHRFLSVSLLDPATGALRATAVIGGPRRDAALCA
ncbi:MAG TPA: hypothetical protein VI078_03965, partial [bacterium]